MNEPIQAIETFYDGYRFRSRLEARWAVFFKAVGIPYLYEPEGFILSNRDYYLPDFYLPWFNLYVDIKPEYEGDEQYNDVKQKLERLMHDKYESGVTTGLFIGDPYANNMYIYCTNENGNDCVYEDWFEAEFVGGAWYHDDKLNGTENNLIEYGYTKHWITVNLRINKDDTRWRHFWQGGHNYESAQRCISIRDNFDSEKQKARQARFEHGESPEVTSS